MKFRIHFIVGSIADSLVVEGDTLEEIRTFATNEVDKRGGKDAWSEEIHAS